MRLILKNCRSQTSKLQDYATTKKIKILDNTFNNINKIIGPKLAIHFLWLKMYLKSSSLIVLIERCHSFTLFKEKKYSNSVKKTLYDTWEA